MTPPIPTMVTTGRGQLTRDASVVLDANGNGQASLGPVPAGQVWSVTRITVSCDGTNNPMPRCQVYDGPATPGNLIDATYTGGLDSSDYPNALTLQIADELLFVWTGGVPASVATARLVGYQSSQ